MQMPHNLVSLTVLHVLRPVLRDHTVMQFSYSKVCVSSIMGVLQPLHCSTHASYIVIRTDLSL